MSILKQMMEAVERAQADKSIMDRQLERMKQRVSQGKDIRGGQFAPFKRLPKDGRQIPLGRGGLLIARAKVDHSTSWDGVDLRATIVGMTARIAYYQNRHRQFWGFSDEDRIQVVHDFKSAMRSNR